MAISTDLDTNLRSIAQIPMLSQKYVDQLLPSEWWTTSNLNKIRDQLDSFTPAQRAGWAILLMRQAALWKSNSGDGSANSENKKEATLNQDVVNNILPMLKQDVFNNILTMVANHQINYDQLNVIIDKNLPDDLEDLQKDKIKQARALADIYYRRIDDIPKSNNFGDLIKTYELNNDDIAAVIQHTPNRELNRLFLNSGTKYALFSRIGETGKETNSSDVAPINGTETPYGSSKALKSALVDRIHIDPSLGAALFSGLGPISLTSQSLDQPNLTNDLFKDDISNSGDVSDNETEYNTNLDNNPGKLSRLEQNFTSGTEGNDDQSSDKFLSNDIRILSSERSLTTNDGMTPAEQTARNKGYVDLFYQLPLFTKKDMVGRMDDASVDQLIHTALSLDSTNQKDRRLIKSLDVLNTVAQTNPVAMQRMDSTRIDQLK